MGLDDLRAMARPRPVLDRDNGLLGLDVLSKATRRGTTFVRMTRSSSRAALRAYLTSEDSARCTTFEPQADLATHEAVAN